MFRTHRLSFLIVFSTMAAALLLFPTSAERKVGGILPAAERDTSAARKQERLEKLLEQATRSRGVARERLTVGDLVIQKYPVSGVEISQAKFVDKETGEVFATALDAADNPADAQAAAEQELKARARRYGKIDPALHAKMEALERNEAGAKAADATAAAAARIPVSLWLNVPDMPLVRPQSASDPYLAQANLAAHLTALETDMTPKRRGALAAVKRFDPGASGAKYAPAVFANLTPAQIRAVVKRGDVEVAYDGAEKYGRHNDDVATTARVHRVWAAGNLGQLNAGMVRPVVHEDDGIADFNPYLNNSKHAVIFWCTPGDLRCPYGKNNDGADLDHASLVAGVIGSTHPLYRGIAPSSQVLLSANSQDFSDANTVAAFEWARANGGDPTNMSWGTICGGGNQTFDSRYVDWAVSHLFATVVVSAGNTSIYCYDPSDPNANFYVSSPGLAWNAITVGSQYDNNNSFWSGDGMSSFSRHVNPVFASGMEKPEVVAVGEDVITTDNLFGDHLSAIGVQGTSFSAPAVAGQVALMLSRQPGQTFWPETNKAAVLTSAFHDVTAGSRSKDGVGSVVMSVSDDTYRLGRFRNDCGAGCYPLQPANFPRSYSITLTAGQVVRIAIAWNSQATGGSGTDQLGADIDLQVIRPGGTVIASSSSSQNAWELVEFTAPVSGTYTVRANLFSYVSGWSGTFIGMAYAVKALPDYCTGVPAGAGTFAIDTANGPTWFDSYAGWPYNQGGREYIRKLVLTATKDITVTDTNGNIDLHVLRVANCAADPVVPTSLAHGDNSVFVDNAPAGTYYVVADGYNGAVGTTTLKITQTGP